MMKSEAQIQQEIIVWFRNNYCLKHHKPKMLIFSVPNEAAYKNKNLILTGVLAGVSDLIVVIPNKTIYFELKDDKGKQSPKQKEFESTIKNLDQEYYLVRSLKEFQKIILSKFDI